MLNNLLRCDLSEAQLEALSESKGQWWLVEDSYYFDQDYDVLLREWNGFKFYQVDELLGCFEEGLAPAYVITPEGYYLAADGSVLDELDEEADIDEQLKKQFGEIVEDAIATLLNLPEKLGQLSLFGTNNHV